VAELGIIDVRTGWQNTVTVYPQYGRIGVDVRSTSVENDRPIRPIYPPWTPGGRPLPLPVNPDWGMQRGLPVAASQMRALPSALAVTTRRPSGSNEARATGPACFRGGARGSPLMPSQTRAV